MIPTMKTCYFSFFSSLIIFDLLLVVFSPPQPLLNLSDNQQEGGHTQQLPYRQPFHYTVP